MSSKRNRNTTSQTSKNVVRVKNFEEFKQESQMLKSEGYIPLPRTVYGSSQERRDYFRAAVDMLDLNAGDSGVLHASKPVPLIFAQTGQENLSKNGKDIGTEGLGWMEWGGNNRLPNVVSLLTGMLPYTAVAHKFNTDLLSGMGPNPMYRYTQYVGGNITTKEIPYHDAGRLLQGQITELLQQLAKLEEENPELRDSESLDSIRKKAMGKKVDDTALSSRSSVELLHDQMQERLNGLTADYKEWEKTDAAIRTFMANNGLALTSLQLAADFQLLGICFPELQLSRDEIDDDGKPIKGNLWKPKVVNIAYRPAHICRLERMDKDWRINYVYLSNQWLEDPYLMTSANTDKTGEVFDIDALPAVRVDKGVGDVNELVRAARLRNAKAKDRPTRIIMPIYYPTVGCPYYPKPAWQSIFAGDIYEYAATIISDRLTRKRNSNVIGRIIYLNQGYLNSLFSQHGAQTSEQQSDLMEKLYSEINNYLSNRDNTGSSLLAYTFIGSDEKEHESFRIVEIESSNKGTADANQKELQELSSIISFAWSLDARLIGNTPGTESSSGGTDLRERYMVKQIQMAPTTQLFLRPFEVASEINDWDREHLVWRIKREVMTTLDNSKTGVTESKTNDN